MSMNIIESIRWKQAKRW